MNTFYARLSALFLALMTGVVVLVGFQSLTAATQFVDETEQKLNQDLATVMAVDFQPFLRDSIDHAAIQEKISYLTGVNPRVDIYLLGNTGMIKALFVESGREPVHGVLDTTPLDQMMAGAPLPIWGMDPLEDDLMKPFSVAPLEIMGEEGCYLYVVLGSERYDSAASMIRESYILRTLARSLGLVFLITGLVGLLLFAVLTRRLRSLNAAVRAFSRGDYSSRGPANGSDEIGELGRSFNDMASTIERNVAELERTDTLRRELVANVSHDLRSPLAAIQGYLETILIKAETASRSDLTRYVETALKGTRRLGRLIAQLFELSKLDANQIRLDPEQFSLVDLVQDVGHQFMPKAEESGVNLVFDIPEHTPLVFGDIALVERAISNLVDNAIRFTPTGGEVRLAPAVSGDGVRVRVSDTGVGIAPQQLERIFDRFYRVDESRDKETGGAGLGLAIAKKILDLHQTTLSVRSVLNEGTTFSFTLPFRALPVPA